MQNNPLQLVYQQTRWNGRYTACPVPGAAGFFPHFFVITPIHNTSGFLELNKPFVSLLWALSVCLCHMVQCEAGSGHLFNLGFLPLVGESKVIQSTYPHVFWLFRAHSVPAKDTTWIRWVLWHAIFLFRQFSVLNNVFIWWRVLFTFSLMSFPGHKWKLSPSSVVFSESLCFLIQKCHWICLSRHWSMK